MKEQMFTEAYHQLFHVVFSTLASKIGNNKMDAEDITQEIFLLLLNKFDTIENPRKWIYGVMNNKVREYLREKKHKEEDIELIINDVHFTYANGFRDTRIIIKEIIDNDDIYNDKKEKKIFDLIAIRNLSISETAKITGIPFSTLRKKYCRIKDNVVEMLKKQGIEKLEDLL